MPFEVRKIVHNKHKEHVLEWQVSDLLHTNEPMEAPLKLD